MNLTDKNINYIIVSAHNPLNTYKVNEQSMAHLEDTLFIKNYTWKKIQSHKESYFIAYKEAKNNELKKEAIEIMNSFNQEFIIIKYTNTDKLKKIYKTGIESDLILNNINGFDFNDLTLFGENFYFSFREFKSYILIEEKSQLKDNMVVEFQNNKNIWTEYTIDKLDDEYDNFLKLLIKYKKLRFK